MANEETFVAGGNFCFLASIKKVLIKNFFAKTEFINIKKFLKIVICNRIVN